MYLHMIIYACKFCYSIHILFCKYYTHAHCKCSLEMSNLLFTIESTRAVHI